MKREEIIFRIHTGKIDPVFDADHIHTDDSLEEVHFIHEADDGSVNINYSYETAAACIEYEDGTDIREFDIASD